MIRIGSHVGMNGKEMMLGSAKEAASYGANVFMAYTGAPQNTRRKEITAIAHTLNFASHATMIAVNPRPPAVLVEIV